MVRGRLQASFLWSWATTCSSGLLPVRISPLEEGVLYDTQRRRDLWISRSRKYPGSFFVFRDCMTRFA